MIGIAESKLSGSFGFSQENPGERGEEIGPEMAEQEPKMMKTTAPGPVVEISLLLPEWQANLLETEAFELGVSPATMLRKLLVDHLLPKVQGSKLV